MGVPVVMFLVGDAAHEWAMGRDTFHNQRTIKDKGDNRGKYIGNLGEFFFSQELHKNNIDHECVGKNVHTHDFIVGRVTIDAKTKERTYNYIDRPNRYGNDEGHVKTDQEGFECDIYVFCSAHSATNTSRAQSIQILGWIGKREFWRNCQRVEDGEETAPNFFERADAGKLLHTNLKPMEDLIDKLNDHMTKRRFDYEV